MVAQLIWLEILAKAGAGLVLLLVPGTAIKVLGLPAAGSSFWPRLLGASLLAVAGALVLKGRFQAANAIGFTGLVVLNLTLAAMVIAELVLGRPAPARRGRLVLWLSAALLLAAGFTEIAYAD